MTAQDLARVSATYYWEQLPKQLRLQLLDTADNHQWFVNLDSRPDSLTESYLKLLGFKVEEFGGSFVGGSGGWCVSWFPKE